MTHDDSHRQLAGQLRAAEARVLVLEAQLTMLHHAVAVERAKVVGLRARLLDLAPDEALRARRSARDDI